MKLRVSMVLAVALVLTVSAFARDDAKSEQDKLQGNWTIMADERDGQPVSTDKGAKVTFTNDKFVTASGGKTLRQGSIKLDPTKKPKTIDVTYTEGEFKGKTFHGVYTLEGDTWTICYNLTGDERPKEVPTKAGKGQLLFHLQRAK